MVNRFKFKLINNLVVQWYRVTYTIVPLKPTQVEYYIYVNDKENNKQIFFSNNKSKYKDTVIEHEIDDDNSENWRID